MDLFPHYKKRPNESSSHSSKTPTHSPSTKDLSLSQTATSSINNSKQQQYATKLPSEKSSGGSFLKEALMTGSSSPKISSSPLTVDSMLTKSLNSPKTNLNTTTKPSPTLQSPTNHVHRSSGSSKSNTNRPSTAFTHNQSDQHVSRRSFKRSTYFFDHIFRFINKKFIHLQIDHNRMQCHLLHHHHLDAQQQDFLRMNNK